MNLYLSRLCLNPLFAPALKLAADPYELHRKLLGTLPCGPKPKPASARQPKTADLLFRVDATDAGPVVLVQTSAEPDWDALELAPRALRCPPQTKPYGPQFRQGHRLGFRLLCQPVIRKSGQFGLKANGKRMPGPRRACRTDEQRLEWLRRKAEGGGFALETIDLSPVDWLNTKPIRAKGGGVIEGHDQAKKRAFGPGTHQRLGAVRFEGMLQVIDSEKFRAALASGIGPAKAFGFGLLSVAPAP
jgi:CRISPR system Cascade subunit CasE